MRYRSKETTHNIFRDLNSGKEIHYVLFPEDTVFPAEVEIQHVYNQFNEEIDWTNEQETEWVDAIMRRVEP